MSPGALESARLALAEVLSEELDEDLTLEFLAAVDKVLVKLWLRGYCVAPLPDEPERV